MFPTVTHYDLVVILAISFAIQLGGLVFVAYIAWKGPRELAGMVAEAQRLTRAVGGLVAQESEKIRAMFPETRR